MKPTLTVELLVTRAVLALMLVMFSSCELLLKDVPVMCTRRESVFGNGFVIKVQSQSEKTLSLWIQTSEKKEHFTLEPYGNKEFGWLEGFHFGDNSTYTIGGEGYSALTFSKDEG